MTKREEVSKLTADIIVDIVATDNLELRIKGLRGLRYTLEQLLYDVSLDLGEAVALKQISGNQ